MFWTFIDGCFFYIIYIIRKFTIQALSAHKNLTQSDCNHCDETIPARDIPNQVNGIPNTAPKTTISMIPILQLSCVYI